VLTRTDNRPMADIRHFPQPLPQTVYVNVNSHSRELFVCKHSLQMFVAV